MPYNTVILLGPTAVGKTALGVRIAAAFGWDIISADCRQVYKGLDLGSGKDLAEYTFQSRQIPHHLIDIVTLEQEYNVFNFQKDFYTLFDDFSQKGKMPFVVGGTGMYLDSIVRGYDFVPVPENDSLRAEIAEKSLAELGEMLLKLKPDLHNKTDLLDRNRTIRAIEIQLFMKSDAYKKIREQYRGERKINAFVMGTTLPRDLLRARITRRLRERFAQGMIEEVERLHQNGYSWERLEKLGLEYRYISEYLEGKIKTEEDLFVGLNHAIQQFAKRQETWFRSMERKGVAIHWLPPVENMEAKYASALKHLQLLYPQECSSS